MSVYYQYVAYIMSYIASAAALTHLTYIPESVD